MPASIYRKGLDLKLQVAGELASDYHSQLIEKVKDAGYRWQAGRVTVHLAREFGFCYGVDRAVGYAYQTRLRFPDRRVFLTDEIIHNPQVNKRLCEAGVRFLSDPGESMDDLVADDVVIIPAFGVTVADLERLDQLGCTLVDTTCGSVLNVWRKVQEHARDGFTSVIHGKLHHEETRATASQAAAVNGGHYVVILDEEQTRLVCDVICGQASRERFMDTFRDACSPGFDPDRDLQRVGLANQTTMLMSESVAIGEMIRQAMIACYGAASLDDHYRALDTICSATQDRQDALKQMLDAHRFDLAVVIGGYNSSNTRNLARICAQRLPTYHIAAPTCLVSASELRHQPLNAAPGAAGAGALPAQTVTRNWLPQEGDTTIAVTAGASTPDSVVGEVIEKLTLLAQYGVTLATKTGQARPRSCRPEPRQTLEAGGWAQGGRPG